MTEHTISIEERFFRDGAAWYRAACSCSKYHSRWRGFRGHAALAGDDHARAMKIARQHATEHVGDGQTPEQDRTEEVDGG